MQLASNSKDVIVFKVSRPPRLKKETIYLRIQIRGVVYSIAKALLDKEITINIPLKDLPQGIAEVTLFNEDLRPVAERLVYVNQDQKLNIKAVLDKSEYLTKEQVKLKLKVTDLNGKPIVAHLGLVVYDQLYKNADDPKTIESHYQLSAQLKGRLFDPGYYFDKKNKVRKQALNLLLMTQGWRRYIWSEENLKTQKTSYQPNLEGRLTYTKKGKNTPQQSLMVIYNPLDDTKKLFIPLDSIGRFTLTTDHLKMGRQLYLKHFGTNKDKILVTIKNPFSIIKKNKSNIYPFMSSRYNGTYSESQTNTWETIQNRITLEEVVVKSKKKHVFRDKYLGKLDSLAKLEMTSDYVCKYNILNCEYHVNDEGNFKPIQGKTYLYIEVFDGKKWRKGHPRLISDTKYFRNPALPPYRYPKLTDAYLMEKYNLIKTEGYYGKREFYSPVYNEMNTDDSFPDYRNTLFWSPNIITDKNGEVSLSFYCSDINSKFLGTIEGVSRDGQLGRQNFEFRVRKRE